MKYLALLTILFIGCIESPTVNSAEVYAEGREHYKQLCAQDSLNAIPVADSLTHIYIEQNYPESVGDQAVFESLHKREMQKLGFCIDRCAGDIYFEKTPNCSML